MKGVSKLCFSHKTPLLRKGLGIEESGNNAVAQNKNLDFS